MRKLLTFTFTILGCAAFCPLPALALGFSAPKPKFLYNDASGKKQSADVVDKYYPKKIVQPVAGDSKIDPKLRRAATIAEERARAHSLSKCWHFVKDLGHTVCATSGSSEDPAGKSASGARMFADDSANTHRDVVGPAKHLNGDDARLGQPQRHSCHR